MTNSIRNPKLLRKGNKSMILRKLYNHGAMSRLSLAKECQLTTAAMTMVTKIMIEEGSLLEVGSIHKINRGRREVLIDINYKQFVAAGVNIEGDNIHFSLCQLDKVIREEICPTDIIKEKDPIPVLKEHIDKIIGGYEEKLLGIGVGVIGVIDDAGLVVMSYGLFNDNYELRAQLEKYYHYPIIVSNNVRAQTKALISEKDLNFVLVKHGPGVGSAIVIDGNIVKGKNNRAGELGHTIVESNGKLCKCGKRGCLEAYLAEENIVFRYNEMTNIKRDIISIYNLYSIDNSAKKILDDCIEKMAIAISNVSIIIDPMKVLVSGGIFNHEELYNNLINKMKKYQLNKHIKRVDSDLRIKSIAGSRLVLRSYLFEV